MSPNHFYFSEDTQVEQVIEISCRRCGKRADAFTYSDGWVDVQDF